MDKNEILEKSRKENRGYDERERNIQSKANNAALWWITLANCTLLLLAWVQEIRTGQSFANPWVFMLTAFISTSANSLVHYHYLRKRSDLIIGLFDIFICLLALANIFGFHLNL